MTIRQQGGVFGRNPSFSDVNVDSLTASGDVTGANLLSGTYIPTLTADLNVSTSTAHLVQYFRVGDMVTVCGQVTFTATSASSPTRLNISLPIPSVLGGRPIGGAGASISPANYGQSFAFSNSSGTAQVRASPSTTGSTTYGFSFTYRIT